MINQAQAVFLFLNLTLIGGLILLGVTLAFKFIPLRRTRLRYVIALGAFACAFLLPVAAMFRSEPSPSLVSAVQHVTEPGSQLRRGVAVIQPMSDPFVGLVRRLEQFVTAHTVFVVIPIIWIVGAIFLVGREVFGHVAMARIRGQWQPAGAELEPRLKQGDRYRWFVSDQIGPCVVGLFSPVIVFPRGLVDNLPPIAFKQLVEHELAHARWRDPLANAIVRLIRGCFWPSLALWRIAEIIQGEREAAADQAALKSTLEKKETIHYINTLLSISSQRSAEGAVFFRYAGTHAGGVAPLEKRIQRMMVTTSEGTGRGLICGAFILVVVAVAIGLSPVATADRSPDHLGGLSERVYFNPDGPTATLVKETVSGVVEERVLQRTESELRAAAFSQPLPDLPPLAEGVVLMLLVNEQGKVSSARVVAGNADPRVGASAIAAVRQWNFSPATFDGKPTKVVGTITLLGPLRQKNGWVELR